MDILFKQDENTYMSFLSSVTSAGGATADIMVDEMPTASASELKKIYHYIGVTDANYTHGHFYECQEDGSGGYEWVEVQVQVDKTGQVIQLKVLPEASEDELGNIYQYVGATNVTYTNGFFYKCGEDPNNVGTYIWTQTNVQPSGGSATVRNEKIIATAADFRQTQGSYSFKTSAAVTITLADANTITIPANIQGIFDVGETDTTLNDYIGLIQYTDNSYEKKIYFTSSMFYVPSTDNVQIDDNNVSSATTYSSAKIETAIGGSKAAQMTGATSYQDGKEGLATKPLAGDNQKALFGDGRYHTIYAANTGSTIVVTTNEPTLYSRPLTLTAGSTTLQGTFSATGECTFNNLSVYGAVSISSSDAQGNPAKGSTNITYFGTYVVGVGFNFATVKFTSRDMTLAGVPVAIYLGDTLVTETSLSSDGQGGLQAICYVEELGTYKAIAQTSAGKARASVRVAALHQTYTAELIVAEIYGFKINKSDSNPATCVTAYDLNDYDVANANFTPAHMDYTNSVFDYGSWTALATGDRSEVFFAPKPCMLNYDGTVAYYLDPTDFTKKADGTASDIADDTFGGNAMVEFPTVWFKRWEQGGYAYVLIADKQVDIDFHAYAHHDKNGHILDNIYISMYDGWYDGTKLRSISGKAPSGGVTCQTEIDRAAANNTVSETGEGWFTLHKADWDLVNSLLVLIGYSTHTQACFGYGKDTKPPEVEGELDQNGMFFGYQGSGHDVTTFGICNWWGNLWLSMAGWVNDKGTQKIKMTYGTEDGSTASGFSTTGTGYVSVVGFNGSNGFIKECKVCEQGFVPYMTGASASTYYSDGLWSNSSRINYINVGGADNGDNNGAFCSYLDYGPDRAAGPHGASLTYKGLVPQAQGGNG